MSPSTTFVGSPIAPQGAWSCSSERLIRRSAQVHLIASESLAARSDWLDPAVRVTSFLSYRDLEHAVHIACQDPPDPFLMAAAVADYSPVPFKGKLSSDVPEQTLTLRRNPKLLASLSKRCQGQVPSGSSSCPTSPMQLLDTALGQVRAHVEWRASQTT